MMRNSEGFTVAPLKRKTGSHFFARRSIAPRHDLRHPARFCRTRRCGCRQGGTSAAGGRPGRGADRNSLWACRKGRQRRGGRRDLSREGPTQLQPIDRPCARYGRRRAAGDSGRAGTVAGRAVLAGCADHGAAVAGGCGTGCGSDCGPAEPGAALSRPSGDARAACSERPASGRAIGQPQRGGKPDPARTRPRIAGRGSRPDRRWRHLRTGARIDDCRASRGRRLGLAAAWPGQRGRDRGFAGEVAHRCRSVKDRSPRPARQPLFAGKAGSPRCRSG